MQEIEQVNNDWVAIVGLVIAICAICLTIWQGYMTKKHNTLAIRPAVCSWVDISRKNNTFSFWIKNKGHGTAKIEEFNLSINDKIATTKEFEADFINESTKFGIGHIIYGSQKSGAYLEKSERVDIVSITFEIELPEGFVEHIQERYNLEIKYSSLYGEKLTFNTNEFR